MIPSPPLPPLPLLLSPSLYLTCTERTTLLNLHLTSLEMHQLLLAYTALLPPPPAPPSASSPPAPLLALPASVLLASLSPSSAYLLGALPPLLASLQASLSEIAATAEHCYSTALTLFELEPYSDPPPADARADLSSLVEDLLAWDLKAPLPPPLRSYLADAAGPTPDKGVVLLLKAAVLHHLHVSLKLYAAGERVEPEAVEKLYARVGRVLGGGGEGAGGRVEGAGGKENSPMEEQLSQPPYTMGL
ncbi:hypothetical protein TeGR_g11273 [Tetraparma gracilis]|uniref:Uncharacterized protein n=1 Tax=Tetraparma gracilis TaxID=2962635 RepID=A0ABQ6MYD6_9STRA|nr:hypothetical protein TeGR_g11273 [Tetraparma gracilis]